VKGVGKWLTVVHVGALIKNTGGSKKNERKKVTNIMLGGQ